MSERAKVGKLEDGRTFVVDTPPTPAEIREVAGKVDITGRVPFIFSDDCLKAFVMGGGASLVIGEPIRFDGMAYGPEETAQLRAALIQRRNQALTDGDMDLAVLLSRTIAVMDGLGSSKWFGAWTEAVAHAV